MRRVVSSPPAELGYNTAILVLRPPMSNHNDAHTSDDPVENVVKYIPMVIPAAGAVLIFLLLCLPIAFLVLFLLLFFLLFVLYEPLI